MHREKTLRYHSSGMSMQTSLVYYHCMYDQRNMRMTSQDNVTISVITGERENMMGWCCMADETKTKLSVEDRWPFTTPTEAAPLPVDRASD